MFVPLRLRREPLSIQAVVPCLAEDLSRQTVQNSTRKRLTLHGLRILHRPAEALTHLPRLLDDWRVRKMRQLWLVDRDLRKRRQGGWVLLSTPASCAGDRFELKNVLAFFLEQRRSKGRIAPGLDVAHRAPCVYSLRRLLKIN